MAADYIAAGEQRLAELRAELAKRSLPPVCVAVLNQDGRHAAVYGRNSMVQDVLDRPGVENAWQGPVGPVGLAMVSIERLAERPDAHLSTSTSPPPGTTAEPAAAQTTSGPTCPPCARGTR